mgnify:CR=1 FL=1
MIRQRWARDLDEEDYIAAFATAVATSRGRRRLLCASGSTIPAARPRGPRGRVAQRKRAPIHRFDLALVDQFFDDPQGLIAAVGAGVEWQWKGFEIHNNLNYADLGDGDLDQDGGLAGRIEGSFDTNYAVVLDTQIIKRF